MDIVIILSVVKKNDEKTHLLKLEALTRLFIFFVSYIFLCLYMSIYLDQNRYNYIFMILRL